MIRVSVMYPNEKGKRFDLDYFATSTSAWCTRSWTQSGW